MSVDGSEFGTVRSGVGEGWGLWRLCPGSVSVCGGVVLK